MAEDDDAQHNLLTLKEDLGIVGQQEADPVQGTARPDLFGDSESDEEEAQAPISQKPPEQVQDLNPSLTYELEGLAAEGQIAEEEDREAEPEIKETHGTGDSANAAPIEDDQEALMQQDKAPDAQAEEGYAGQGAIDDVFASDSEDERQQPAGLDPISEAEEEEDAFEALFAGSKKKKRGQGRTHEMVETVETLISSMELAAEMDNTANEAQKPAVNKIKMLASVENAVGQSNLHKELLDAGFLGALKLWIEPLPDFSLPNVKVRTAVLGILHKLPIDLHQEGRKAQLKKSQLGRYVAFYSKLQDETLPNRKLARGLVERWSRTIYEQYKETGEEEVKQEQEAHLALQRKRRQQAEAREGTEPTKRLKQGDPGFRWHATIPAPAKLDYMRRPDSMVQSGEGEAVKGKAKPKDRMSKKLAAMSRKGSRKGAGDSKVSLQGRGLLL